ncbi:hypothetical protein FRC17_008403, partial [Serendipita sp. 399]
RAAAVATLHQTILHAVYASANALRQAQQQSQTQLAPLINPNLVSSPPSQHATTLHASQPYASPRSDHSSFIGGGSMSSASQRNHAHHAQKRRRESSPSPGDPYSPSTTTSSAARPPTMMMSISSLTSPPLSSRPHPPQQQQEEQQQQQSTSSSASRRSFSYPRSPVSGSGSASGSPPLNHHHSRHRDNHGSTAMDTEASPRSFERLSAERSTS